MLEVLVVANIASEFRALMDGVFLKLFHSFPNNNTLTAIISKASMRELTKVDTVLKNLVDLN